ncbi:MAG: sugar phosphate isomerase/epimerase, partial [Armatimonadota bacterium]
KLLKDLGIGQLADTIEGLGFGGFDLAVRPGYPINPENVATALPEAAKEWAARGLTIGLVTTNFDFVDPGKPEVEPLLGACAEVGCRRIKLGYWVYQGEPYWEGVDRIRKALGGFERLCRKHDVCVAVHTHSGPYYGSNCAGAMHLVRDFDPRYVGVYIDPGHLSIDGEDLPMAISMVREHLVLVAAKSLAWFRSEEKGAVKWEHRLVPMREGLVDWLEVLELLGSVNYEGPISLHSEYEDLSREELLSVTRDDLAYLKSLLPEA